MQAIQCMAPNCPDPSAPAPTRFGRAPSWLSLLPFGLDGRAHPNCVKRLRRRVASGRPLGAPSRAVAPCSLPDCPSPRGGYRKPGRATPDRVRLVIGGRPRVFCRNCGRLAKRRIEEGADVDAPRDDPDDTGPEPSDDEIEALFALDNWHLAAWRINCTLAALPPVVLDELKGAAFSGRLIEAFYAGDIRTIYGEIAMYDEVR